MKSITSKISIIILSLMACTFTFAEPNHGLHEGCTNQNPDWSCGHCCPGGGCTYSFAVVPETTQCSYGMGPNGIQLAESGEFTCDAYRRMCTAAELYQTWTGCGPESASGSCYGKPPTPPISIPPPTDKCMGMGCNPDTYSPTLGN
jgi:hypothetical protein